MPDREKTLKAMECIAGRSNGSVVEAQCRECPYCDSTFESGCDAWAMIVDALALLKEQEPRAMTWKDVKESVGIPVWIEYEEYDAWNGYGVPTSDYGNYMMIFGANAYTGHYDNSYNVKWRAWTSRPTPEQMRDTPWEEMP